MTKYYTVINLANNKFVGYVYNEANNEKMYQTQEYDNQSQAVSDVNAYLQGNATQQNISSTPNTYVNTIKQAVPTPAPRQGRCCGR
jgi:hypothetical protein